MQQPVTVESHRLSRMHAEWETATINLTKSVISARTATKEEEVLCASLMESGQMYQHVRVSMNHGNLDIIP